MAKQIVIDTVPWWASIVVTVYCLSSMYGIGLLLLVSWFEFHDFITNFII